MVKKTPRRDLNDYGPGDTGWDHSKLVNDYDEHAIVRAPVADRPAEGDYDDELFYATDQSVLWGWDEDASDWTIRGGTGSESQPLDSLSTDDARINNNKSVRPGDLDDLTGNVKVSVVDDEGVWHAATTGSEFIKSEAPHQGYTKIADLPFGFPAIHGLHLTASGNFITGSEGSIWLSTDGGSSWSAVQSLSNNDGLWGISENSAGELTAVQYDSEFVVWQSTDGGQSWTQIADVNDHVTPDYDGSASHWHDVAYDPNDDQTLIVSGHFTEPVIAQISRDGGSTWSEISATDPWHIASAGITWHPTKDGVYFVGTDGGDWDGIARLKDDGGTGTVQTFINCKSGMGGRAASGMVFSIRAVEKPDGSYYFVGATRASGLMDNSAPDNPDTIVASMSGEGMRWRAIETANGANTYLQASQGTDKKVLSVSDNPYLVTSSKKVLDLHDAGNPLYGYALPQLTLGNGDAISLWNAEILLGEHSLRGNVGGAARIENKDGDRGWSVQSDGQVRIGDFDNDQTVYIDSAVRIRSNPLDLEGQLRLEDDMDLQGNAILPDGFNASLPIRGDIGFANLDPSDSDGVNGNMGFYQEDPSGQGRGQGFYGRAGDQWGKLQLDFG